MDKLKATEAELARLRGAQPPAYRPPSQPTGQQGQSALDGIVGAISRHAFEAPGGQ